MANEKNYELGDKASLFVDTETKKKIAPGQVVSFSSAERKSLKFKDALRGGHIREAVEEEEDEDDELTTEQKTFRALKVKEKISYLLETFELSADEEAAIKVMKSADLNDKFDELNDDAEDA